MREFTVVGLFQVGIEDHDGELAYASLPVLESLGARRSGAEGLAIEFADALSAPDVAKHAAGQRCSSAGRASRPRTGPKSTPVISAPSSIEKTMMALILLLIVAVAAFNIVAMLVMVVSRQAHGHRHPAHAGAPVRARWPACS